MPLLELLPDIFTPTFEMKAGGRPLEEEIAKSILEVSVTEHLNPPSQFHFSLNDPALEFIDRKDGRFTEGNRVEISIGYVGAARKMLVGEITALSADFPSDGPATLLVEGFDSFHAMTRGTIYRMFEEGALDSDIATQIAREMGLKASVVPTLSHKGPRVQDQVTNLSFLEMLAEENGYFLWVDGDTLYFTNERPAPDTITLEWGKTLMSFSPRLSTAGQVNVVEVRGWDPIQKQSISARVERSGEAQAELSETGQKQLARGAGGRSELVLEDVQVSSAQQAEARANRILLSQQEASVEGSGTSVGQPDMRVGTILELRGVGRFSGRYIVEQVTHTVGSGGYTTSFQVVSKQP